MNKLAEQENIREASLFVIGALSEGRMITGFKNIAGDLDRRELGKKREFFAIGNLSWPSERPNAVPETVSWDTPRPYAHFHLALGPDVGATDPETLVGHLDKASIVGAFVDIYELL